MLESVKSWLLPGTVPDKPSCSVLYFVQNPCKARELQGGPYLCFIELLQPLTIQQPRHSSEGFSARRSKPGLVRGLGGVRGVWYSALLAPQFVLLRSPCKAPQSVASYFHRVREKLSSRCRLKWTLVMTAT
ncbi:hypothetical protein E2C01_040293 [Portunus trituberculatus]|uniref:Uncharacterized protein n=1 Tax=Portunus trituberculatus TaxID=210409 RepID=A0A5B7FJB5_PORTR|nr:hypothetical protein [Portunus trituberculatus]